jgi:hypothetical protein
VIVTGSRKWQDKRAVFTALENLLKESGAFTLVHGACATGADAMAEEWYQLIGHEQGVLRVRRPAPWAELGDAAGPARNRQMIKDGADLVLAFPLPDGSGTQHTMQLARDAGIEVVEPCKEG